MYCIARNIALFKNITTPYIPHDPFKRPGNTSSEKVFAPPHEESIFVLSHLRPEGTSHAPWHKLATIYTI